MPSSRSASVTSSKIEKDAEDLKQEIEAIRAMNSALNRYLISVRGMKKELKKVVSNFHTLENLNAEWAELLETRQRGTL